MKWRQAMSLPKRQLALFSVAMAAAIGLSMALADLPVAMFFHDIRDNLLVQIAAATTDAGLAVWYLVGAAILFLLFHFVLHHRQIAKMSAFVFASVAASGIVADVLKVVFGRTRPKLLFRDELFQFHWFKFGADWNSFPSGHSTSVATVTVALCLVLPGWTPIFLPLGVVLIATRVITTAHYLSDTLFATYVGVTITFWVYHQFRRRGLFPAKPTLDQGETA
ncbi:MAG TPA: phosphatase PAP2 family protein [Patescibacteria group bacterium]|nr:phosphatase PAP2 family protein [Patescibacteria group bacterium]